MSYLTLLYLVISIYINSEMLGYVQQEQHDQDDGDDDDHLEDDICHSLLPVSWVTGSHGDCCVFCSASQGQVWSDHGGWRIWSGLEKIVGEW